MRHQTHILTPDDFEISDTTLPEPQVGQVLARVLMFSLDPYLARSMQTWIGETPDWRDGIIRGRLLSEVVHSEAAGIAVGDLIVGLGRWQEFEVFDAERVERVDDDANPASLSLGVMSASGLTAWVGLHLAAVKLGETVLISAATGTVGSVAGQLARQRGCRVIGLAGGQAKCEHAVKSLGFHACVDHRAPDLEKQIATVADHYGIDVVFENVGAPSMDAALPSMVTHGRILLCGLAAHYNSASPATLQNFILLLYKQISITPFSITEQRALWTEARTELAKSIADGSIKYDETIVDGFENAPVAYLDMLLGIGLGKRLLRIAD
jgi:hypothetical protein